MILGYVNDLRIHPVRFMIQKGLQISVSSGHPGLFGYQDLALDYLMIFVAWDLSLRDLKKIAINGLIHSSCDAETIKRIQAEQFNKQWNQFIEFVIENYGEE